MKEIRIFTGRPTTPFRESGKNAAGKAATRKPTAAVPDMDAVKASAALD